MEDTNMCVECKIRPVRPDSYNCEQCSSKYPTPHKSRTWNLEEAQSKCAQWAEKWRQEHPQEVVKKLDLPEDWTDNVEEDWLDSD